MLLHANVTNLATSHPPRAHSHYFENLYLNESTLSFQISQGFTHTHTHTHIVPIYVEIGFEISMFNHICFDTKWIH